MQFEYTPRPKTHNHLTKTLKCPNYQNADSDFKQNISFFTSARHYSFQANQLQTSEFL